jgi:hypothetical protein
MLKSDFIAPECVSAIRESVSGTWQAHSTNSEMVSDILECCVYVAAAEEVGE